MTSRFSAEYIGIVSYRKSLDRPNTFLATYYSTRTEDTALGTGIARGDSSEGYLGHHEIRYYEPDGAPAGRGEPYQLTITELGEVRDMTWTQDGETIFRGIGIEAGDQLVATYWRVSDQV